MRIAIKVLAYAVGAMGLILLLVLGGLAVRMHRAETAITTLCQRARIGQQLEDFVTHARELGASLRFAAARDGEPGLASASAGVFTDVWTCEVEHDGRRVLHVRASFQD